MSKNNLILDNWVEEFSKFIADESYKLVKTVGRPKGSKTSKALSTKFLKAYVQSLVYDALTEHKPVNGLTPMRAFALTKQNLTVVRHNIQDEVAAGFEAALNKFSGQSVEYYVTINESPEPKNKEVC